MQLSTIVDFGLLFLMQGGRLAGSAFYISDRSAYLEFSGARV
jgi:hypothetical protein